mmetsp:Transcript_17283/g.32734  ORF Transcript_17283/g.32734 Transcript_17283/m.32734 type:complete len:235 (-) Transcript_17283:211-915(-)
MILYFLIKQIMMADEDVNSSNIPTTPAIVTFNVGGTRYQVSRSLLEQFPDSMLSKGASEEWQKDPDSEIFIDRNGIRFQFVLDYMRDGKVAIPLTQTKASILAELEYFGIDVVDSELVDCSEALRKHGISYAPMVVQHLEESVRKLEKDANSKRLATWVLKQVLDGRVREMNKQPMRLDAMSDADIEVQGIHHILRYNREAIDDANIILKKYGLYMERVEYDGLVFVQVIDMMK